ncbi:hypothetical protein Tco_0628804 [Tanacetum coccineum]|uniref:Copia protein n=1 Tax=Tanacetum coccineum TaxID=301880 RepID=A0ABQ4WRA6_9ASTR
MTLELANRQLCQPDGICKDVLVPVGKFTYPADFVALVVAFVPEEQIPLISRKTFLRTARALIDFVYDEKVILRDEWKVYVEHAKVTKSKLNGIQKVESINMIDIFNVPNYIGFKDLFAQMYSGSPTIQSNDSFPSSSPMKTRDSTFEEFTDEFTLPNSLPPGDDVSILKKDFQEETFQITSNPLFEFDESFRSSNVNPLFEENDKDAEIKSSPSFTLTSPEESEFEAYFEIDSIPPGIDLNLPPTLEVSSSNPTSPTLIGEKIICLLATYFHKKPKLLSRPQEIEEIKEKEDEVSSDVPIHTIVMPIRITFDNPIDFNDHFSKPKDFKKDLTISFDSSESSILPSPLLDSDSPFTAELSASVTLNSLKNEDKVFKPGILVYHAIHNKNLVTWEDNLKENISSGTLLVFKEPSFLLPPLEPPDKCLNFEPILVMTNVVLNEAFYQSNVEDVNSFTIIIWIFLPYFPYTKESPLIRSQNFVFDPVIVRYGYIKNYKKTIKNGQARTENQKSIKRKPRFKAGSQKKSKPQAYGILKGSGIETIVYADSDHAGDYVDRKSTSGVCTFMGCCLTSWFSKKQTALAISTTEAEYVSARKACQQALWMKQALIDYGVRLDDIPIMCDNKGAIDLSKNPVQHSRTKHIEIRHHFLRDNVQKGNIFIEKVSSEDNIADILTKPLKREPFNYLRLGLGMMEQID